MSQSVVEPVRNEDLMAVVRLLRTTSLPFHSEAALQDAVEFALKSAALSFTREHRLTPRDRIDFLCDSGVGVECKVEQSAATVLRQLLRYADCHEVRSLVLVTSCNAHRTALKTLKGKSFHVVWIAGDL